MNLLKKAFSPSKNYRLSETKSGARIRPERKFPYLLSIPPGTEMFHFPGYAPTYVGTVRNTVGLPIQTFPSRRLIGTSSKLIAAIPRLSSLCKA